jgi:acyl-CoA synthetase (AMP-forming)/AMP-acid ligase II
VAASPAVHLCSYLEDSVARFPGNIAVVDADGASLAYAELDRRASCVTGFLRALGVQRGDRVDLALPKSGDAVVALFGAMKAGAGYVPVDWTSPAERIRTILTDCAVKAYRTCGY